MTTTSQQPKASYTLLVSLSFLLTLIVVVLSAYIRFGTYGLGCDNWPDCFGYIGAPEQYQALDSFTDAQVNKPHGIARTFHRLVASVLGIFIIIVLMQAWRFRGQPGYQFRSALGVFLLTVFLSVLGYATPSPWLPWVTMGNLLGGFAMLALLWWMMQRAAVAGRTQTGNSPAKRYLQAGLLIVILQVVLGGWVSANYAGLSCQDWPDCGNQIALGAQSFLDGLNPSRKLEIDGKGFIQRGAAQQAIHILHRVFALLMLIILVIICLRIYRQSMPLRKQLVAFILLLFVQLVAGSLLVVYELPHLVATLHNAIAAILVLLLVNMLHKINLQSG